MPRPIPDLFITHHQRTELKPRTYSNRPASQGEGDLLLKDRLFANMDNHRLWHAQPDHPCQPTGQVVIGQHPGALWVAHELDHVFLAVIGQHDSRLRTAANLGDVCDCLYRHVTPLCLSWRFWYGRHFWLCSGNGEHTYLRALELVVVAV